MIRQPPRDCPTIILFQHAACQAIFLFRICTFSGEVFHAGAEHPHVLLPADIYGYALAAALVGRPELLVLDEPTSGLDPVSTKEVKTLVKALAKKGMTVLTTSHLLADSEDICDRVMILNRGKCAAEGKVSELGESLEEFFLAKVGSGDDFALADFLA